MVELRWELIGGAWGLHIGCMSEPCAGIYTGKNANGEAEWWNSIAPTGTEERGGSEKTPDEAKTACMNSVRESLGIAEWNEAIDAAIKVVRRHGVFPNAVISKLEKLKRRAVREGGEL